MKIMFNKSKPSTNKRHSAPSAAAGSQAQLMMMPTPPGAPAVFYQWAPQPSSSQGGPMYVQPNFVPAPPTPAPKPWEDSSDDSDMEPPKTKKKLKSEASSLGKKRGRPTKKSLEDKKREEFLASLPQLPEGEDQMLGYKKKGVCKACQLYKGLVALKPCGHAKICISCVRDVRESAEKMFRHSKCPVTGCFAQITDWLPLFNVSA